MATARPPSCRQGPPEGRLAAERGEGRLLWSGGWWGWCVGKRGPLTAQGLMQVWKTAVKRAGLPKELSIHSARHTLAVHLLRKTGNLRQVQ